MKKDYFEKFILQNIKKNIIAVKCELDQIASDLKSGRYKKLKLNISIFIFSQLQIFLKFGI